MSSLYCVLHLPKTGGTALRQSLQQHVSYPEVVYAYQRRPQLRKDWTVEEHIADLKQRNALNSIRYVFGHLPRPYLEAMNRPVQWCTVLRNPLTHVISFYNFKKTVQQQSGLSGKRTASLMHFYQHVPELTQECFVRTIVEQMGGIPIKNRVQSQHIDQAFELLQQCVYVGLTEESATDYPMICKLLGVPYVPARSLAAKTQFASAAEQDELHAAMRENPTPDMVLYEKIKQYRTTQKPLPLGEGQ